MTGICENKHQQTISTLFIIIIYIMLQWYHRVVNEYKSFIQKQEKLHWVIYRIKFFSQQLIGFPRITYKINNLSKTDIRFKTTHPFISNRSTRLFRSFYKMNNS